VALVISALSIIGIEMTSFVAILGAAGLAVGMALSGTLQNFAGGVIILLLRPFKVGDFVEASGYTGTVDEIQIFHTTLKTPDNKTVILPNGPLASGSLINYSTEPTRRVDFTFGIAYGDDADNARSVLLTLIKADSRIMTDPEPNVFVGALADSAVNLSVRVWVRSEDYWPVFFDLTEKVYKVFPQSQLNFPFPQMDVHVQNLAS
jgi:small conductance mechanosensitive channel